KQKEGRVPRLRLVFKNGEINFYASAIRLLEGTVDEVYDFTGDVMNEQFDKKKALQKLKQRPDMFVCDALLDQTIFSGVGNIIKNEVLFRIKVHPQSNVRKLPLKKQKELIDEAVNYSFDFLKWKKEYTLRVHWLAHTKKTCPRDEKPLIKEYLGKTNRRSFYCEKCQKLYE
ncbi:MAG TPA: endonuclease, partial [Flavipsychrobacter sp.]|nr:endonuclease [Flavipsychrobacter sp.]